MSWIDDIVNTIKGVPAAAETVGKDIGGGLESAAKRWGKATTQVGTISAKAKAQAAKDAAAKKTKKTGKKTTGGATTLDEKILNTPIYKVGQLLVQQYQSTIKTSPEAKLITPTIDQNAVGQANQTGMALLGLGPSSTAGQWLASQTQAEQAAASPLDAALAQYQQVYQQSGQGVANALTQMAQANALNVATGPGQSWLNELSQRLNSAILGYSSASNPSQLTPAQKATMPPALAQALYAASSAGSALTGTGATKLPTGVAAAGTAPSFSPTGTAGSAAG